MSELQEDLVNLVRSLVCSLVDQPEQAQITSSESDDTIFIEIRAGAEDVGKVIGRQGRIIKSIRTVVRAASSYAGGSRVEIEVVD